MGVTWAAMSDPGLRRATNEDSYCARPDLGLFAIADGMGGHVAGEVASRLAMGAIEQFVGDTATLDLDRTWPVPYDPALGVTGNRLVAAFRLANRRIAEQVGRDASLRGMATTASAVLIHDTQPPVVAHVGDSRIYLLRGGELTRLTRDHSWVEEQVRAGILDARTASQHPWRNVVTRALTGGQDPEVDVAEITLQAGDRVLLCSDGLYAVVSDDEIAGEVQTAANLESLCAALVARANAAGGPDNVTTLAIEIHVA